MSWLVYPWASVGMRRCGVDEMKMLIIRTTTSARFLIHLVGDGQTNGRKNGQRRELIVPFMGKGNLSRWRDVDTVLERDDDAGSHLGSVGLRFSFCAPLVLVFPDARPGTCTA